MGVYGEGTSALGDTNKRQSLQPQPIPPHTDSLPPFLPPSMHTSPLGLLCHPARLFFLTLILSTGAGRKKAGYEP